MMIIGGYKPVCGDIPNNERIVIGEICVVIWFFMFPVIDKETKDKIVDKIGVYTVMSVIMVIISGIEVWYFLNNRINGSLMGDILFCFGGIVIFSYLIYILIGFFKTFFKIVDRVKRFIFPKIKEVSGIINVLEAITAGALAITTFGTSIYSVIQLFKQFINLLKG